MGDVRDWQDMTPEQIIAVVANCLHETQTVSVPSPTAMYIDSASYRDYFWSEHCPNLRKIADAGRHPRSWRFEGEP